MGPEGLVKRAYEAEMEGRREEGGQEEYGAIILSNDILMLSV